MIYLNTIGFEYGTQSLAEEEDRLNSAIGEKGFHEQASKKGQVGQKRQNFENWQVTDQDGQVLTRQGY